MKKRRIAIISRRRVHRTLFSIIFVCFLYLIGMAINWYSATQLQEIFVQPEKDEFYDFLPDREFNNGVLTVHNENGLPYAKIAVGQISQFLANEILEFKFVSFDVQSQNADMNWKIQAREGIYLLDEQYIEMRDKVKVQLLASPRWLFTTDKIEFIFRSEKLYLPNDFSVTSTNASFTGTDGMYDNKLQHFSAKKIHGTFENDGFF